MLGTKGAMKGKFIYLLNKYLLRIYPGLGTVFGIEDTMMCKTEIWPPGAYGLVRMTDVDWKQTHA